MQRTLVEGARTYVRESLWVVPTAITAGSAALAAGIAWALTEASPRLLSWGFSGGADGARAILSAISTSTLQLTATVFSITLVVLQLAATHLSPRIMGVFLKQRTTKLALGVFLGTYAYSLVALYAVRSAETDTSGFVPGPLLWGALVMVALSVGLLIRYIDHVVQSIRVGTVLDAVTHETITEIEAYLPSGEVDDPAPNATAELVAQWRSRGGEAVVGAPHSGTLAWVDEERLVQWAEKNDARLLMLVPVGAHVPRGTPLLEVYSAVGSPEAPVDEALLIAATRTIEQDPAYGIRQIVDIALRALSPSLNDPGTAVRSLDHIHEILSEVAARPVRSPIVCDRAGAARLVIPRMTWDGFVRVAVQEIIDVSAEHVEVVERLLWMMTELERTVPPGRRGVLRQVRSEVDALPAAARRHHDWVGLADGTRGR